MLTKLQASILKGAHAAERDIAAYNPQSRVLGLARTLLALAQLSFLLSTSAEYFMVPVGGEGPDACSSMLSAVSPLCWAEGSGYGWGRWLLVLALLVVASGFLPRWTSWLHLLVTYSLLAGASLTDGGEAAAYVVSLLLAFASVNDRRRWHWQTDSGADRTGAAQGVAWAGHWALRLQVAYIYLNAAVSKTAVEQWQDGTAVYYVTRMEYFGAVGLLGDAVFWLTSIPLVVLVAAWGTIVCELFIAVFVLRGSRWQRWAFYLATALHAGIIVVMGLFSFGMVMIAAVMAACARSLPAPVVGQARAAETAEVAAVEDVQRAGLTSAS